MEDFSLKMLHHFVLLGESNSSVGTVLVSGFISKTNSCTQNLTIGWQKTPFFSNKSPSSLHTVS